MMQGLLFLFMVLAIPGAPAPPQKAVAAPSLVRFEEGWMRRPATAAASAAAYGVIVNDTDQPLAVVSATSDGARTVEFHEMSMQGAMMHMRRLDRIDVSAHGRVTLTSGGSHIMLFGLTRAFAVGEAIILHVRTADGRSIPARIQVRAAETMP